MSVPAGFKVELVAAEPDLVNPVAMTFDERGRIWVTESLEYPRREAGPGRDRVKVLEDTDHDGQVDRVTVFADGLNIPSGIAVGAGGVWVANAPDILYLQDTDGDGRADRREVVVTGFGRDDTHELPNSLTWGPDGWLYGLNGVFNRSVVRQGDREFRFTAAMFRIHPRTRQFELFAEGTSNPWGIAWDHEGSAFLSACVIDHLWHLVESGYYHRQAGAYPPFTWKIESIVDYRHQQAAYCGIHFFDSDAYPEQYRGKLYMGNIHGNCINCDSLTRNGATYTGQLEADFLSANDSWFMPVAQKTGPDGCLYVLDWYDRYHCYQDANRDPTGIDRGKGRLYRIRYKDTPRAGPFNLAEESDPQLLARLKSPNVYFRDIAQRLLCERNSPATRAALESLVLDDTAPRTARMHGLWALVGMGPLTEPFHGKLLAHADPGFRAWGVRAAGNARDISDTLRPQVVSLAEDESPDVRLQVAIAAAKLRGVDTVALLMDVLTHSPEDPLLPRIVWQNLHPRLNAEVEPYFAALNAERRNAPAVAALAPRVCQRLLASEPFDAPHIAQLVQLYADADSTATDAASQCLAVLADEVQRGELDAEKVGRLRAALQPVLEQTQKRAADDSLRVEGVLLAASWRDAGAVAEARSVLASTQYSHGQRARALAALAAAGDPRLIETVAPLLTSANAAPPELRRLILSSFGRFEDEQVATLALDAYPQLEAELRPHAVTLLTSRPAWGRKLLAAIADGRVQRGDVNANQIRKLLAAGDESLQAEITRVWGTLRTERSPDREQTIGRVRQMIRTTTGDPLAGRVVFARVCGNCHRLHGQGQEVGPDITANGRGSFEQLLSNVLDPSLVIGAAYQARIVVTDDGRILTGLLVEDSPQHVAIKQQGGKIETIPRSQVVQLETSKLSLMPEDLEKQLQPQEIADLFTFLALDRPPEDPAAQWLSGFDGPAARAPRKP